MTGSVRVVNFRKDMAPDGSEPEPDEVLIPVDRSNPVLGNKHILRNKLDRKERERVIAAFKADLERDIQSDGAMSQSIRGLAARVQAGEKLVLQCWCKPMDCHGDVIAEKIEEIVMKLIPVANDDLTHKP